MGAHEVELRAFPLLAGLDALLEALPVLRHEPCGFVHDRPDIRRGVDNAFHLSPGGTETPSAENLLKTKSHLRTVCYGSTKITRTFSRRAESTKERLAVRVSVALSSHVMPLSALMSCRCMPLLLCPFVRSSIANRHQPGRLLRSSTIVAHKFCRPRGRRWTRHMTGRAIYIRTDMFLLHTLVSATLCKGQFSPAAN